MKNILVPIGITPEVSKTLQYAIDMAEHFGSALYVVDAYPSAIPTTSIMNVKGIIKENTLNRIKDVIQQVDRKGFDIQYVAQNGDLLSAVRALDRKIHLDMIVVAPQNNDISDDVFLGKVAGSLIKQTEIPVMVAPIEGDFKSPKRLLWAFKKGQVQNPKTLRPLQLLKDKFDTIINGLLVKTPGHKPGDLELDDAMAALVPEPIITANATTYQGVLEHFQSNQPDMLAVIKREQGFFEKLWKTSIVYKHEFYCSIPLLVLKPRSRYR
jgi:nucleotide-binding universal stress UspA family protein